MNWLTNPAKHQDDQIADLTRRLELAEEALEHYADELTWQLDSTPEGKFYMSYTPVDEQMNVIYSHGYDAARHALNAIREGK